MKRENKIVFRIIFLLAVLFCTGINVFSNNDIRATIIEKPAVENCGENNLFPDDDLSDDEQIHQISDSLPATDYTYHLPFPGNCLLIPCYPTPIWQPPKIRI